MIAFFGVNKAACSSPIPDLPAEGLQPVRGGGFDLRTGKYAIGHPDFQISSVGFSRFSSQRIGLSDMYCRMRFNASSLRMMCS